MPREERTTAPCTDGQTRRRWKKRLAAAYDKQRRVTPGFFKCFLSFFFPFNRTAFVPSSLATKTRRPTDTTWTHTRAVDECSSRRI